MARDSQGNYSLPLGTLVKAGDTVLVSQHNPAMSDIEAALTKSLARDGRGDMQAALKMGGNRITNLAAGSDPSDAATVAQISQAAGGKIYTTTAALQAAPIADTTGTLTQVRRAGQFAWTEGDFSSPVDEYNYVQANGIPLSEGAWVRTQDRDEFHYLTGREYLSTFRKNLTDGTNGNTIVYTGDSTVAGTGVAADFVATELLKREAFNHGAWRQVIVNRGQPGQSTLNWRTTYLADDLAVNGGNFQLLICRWGINDFDSAGTNYTVPQFLASYDQALQTIRASRTADQTSVLIMAPNAAIGRGRTEAQWNELIVGLRRLARKYRCAFFDTYNFARDARAGYVWKSWDDLSGSLGPGAAVHPTDPLTGLIHAYIGQVLFGGIGPYKSNSFWVRNSNDAVVQASELIANAKFPMGLSSDIALSANGFTNGDGEVLTYKPRTNGSQTGWQLHANNSGLWWRRMGAVNLAWQRVAGGGSANNVTPEAGFTLPSSAENMASVPGGGKLIGGKGYVVMTTPATLTAGQAIATIAAADRPATAGFGVALLDVFDPSKTPQFERIIGEIGTNGTITTRTASTYTANRVYLNGTWVAA